MEAGVRDLWNPGEAFVPECPLCSGKVKPDDPAALALDWGMRTAKADAGATAFWRLATATEVCHNAAATGSRDPVQDFTQHMQLLTYEADLVGQPPLSPPHNEQPYPEDILFEEGPDDDQDDSEEDEGGVEDPIVGGDEAGREDEKVVTLEDLGLELARGGRIQGGAPDEGIVLPGIGPRGTPNVLKPVCCIDHFNYPSSWYRFSEGAGESAGDTSLKRRIGIGFDMDVEFINDVLLCRCSCCEFKQWVKPRNHPKPREDCRYWDAATQTWQNVAYYGPGGPPANSQFVCPGDRPLDGEKAGIREEAVGTIWVSDCIVKFEDEPASEVMTLESIKKYVRYDATFYGVIIDTCNNNVVRDWAKFKIDFKSKAGKFAWGAEWDGDLTKKPVIFEKIADHDSVPVADKEKPTQYRGAGKVAAIPPPRGWLE